MAARVLAQWRELLDAGAFVKVMPHDYKRVLRELARGRGAAPRRGCERGDGRAESPRPLDAVGETGGQAA